MCSCDNVRVLVLSQLKIWQLQLSVPVVLTGNTFWGFGGVEMFNIQSEKCDL